MRHCVYYHRRRTEFLRLAGSVTFVNFLHWPVEIWADVFSRVQSRACLLERLVLSSSNVSTMAKEMRRNSLEELRLTCHKFKMICDKHPAVTRRFIFLQKLDQPAANLFVHKLLTWLEAGRDFTSVTCFSTQPCLGLLVPQLLAAPTQLRHISMSAVNAANISCLSAYTNLTSCQLHAPEDQTLHVISLQPLMALKSVESLLLSGAEFFAKLTAQVQLCCEICLWFQVPACGCLELA